LPVSTAIILAAFLGFFFYQLTIKTKNMQKILIGTLAGLVAGVAIGLLVAPVAGSDTRRNLANGTKNQWRRLWGKANLEEDPWAEYNERKAMVTGNATA
jgi:gas vesicle protein